MNKMELVTKPFLLDTLVVQKPWGNELFLMAVLGEHVSKLKGTDVSLDVLIKEMPKHCIGEHLYNKHGSTLPIFCKIINALNDLSVQVHPDNDIAKKLENQQFGKTEAWYILKTDNKDAGIYLGFKKHVDKIILQEALKNNTDIRELLNWVPVSKGDIFYIPAGTVHAIGKGIKLFEVQQNSNITYRVYDYSRIDADGKKRELHIDKAIQAIDFCAEKNNVNKTTEKLYSEYFNIDTIQIASDDIKTFHSKKNKKTYQLIFTLDQQITINKEIILNKNELCFVPAYTDSFTISNNTESGANILFVTNALYPNHQNQKQDQS